MSPKSVLITGCSDGGIGAGLALSFQKHGWKVFATTRNISKMASLTNLPNVQLLALDVTSSHSIEAAVEAVKKETGGSLDCLCNNAGALMMMPVLDTDEEEARKMFNVNLWGPLAMIKAFSPLIIKAKGTIANTGSIAGYLNVPFGGAYAASKSAVMILSETLRLEMASFGVKVLTVVTGVVNSNLGSENTGFQLPSTSLYKGAEEAIRERALGGGGAKMSTEEYCEKYVKAVERESSGQVWIGNSTTAVKWGKYLPANVIVSSAPFHVF
ncbi:hypothetical protein CI102_5901 [Trichoderma harzianum]|nr:hypothetical protein CI102_5901 [Trichoderma harzianum]